MIPKDVVIIGAGASGATAAFHLAKAGWKVMLLEKRIFGEIKPCGGGLASSVQNWFPFDLNSVVDETISTVSFSWCLKDPVTAKLSNNSPFWIVKREKLDELITNKAIREGAEFLQPFIVSRIEKINDIWEIFSTEGIKIQAKSIVIADGSNSPWPKILNLGPKKIFHANTTSIRLKGKGNLPPGTARFEFGLVNHGFAWAFPLHSGVNIGVGTFIGNQVTETSHILKQLLPNLGFKSNEGIRKDSKLRVWNGHHNIHGEGILVVGDAASLCDPFLAEGLRPAIMSGFEAASSLNQWLRGETESLASYTQTMKKHWGESMAWGKRIAQVFYRFPRIGYNLGIKRPTAPQRIAEILSGEIGYEDIAQRTIKRLLFQ